MTDELHDYQKVAVDWLQRNDHAGLFLDCGLGKTCVALNALTPEMLPALVIAPIRVATEVWPVEVKRWRSDLTIAVADGTPRRRREAFASGADIVVLGRDVTSYALGEGARFKTLILDELSSFKSPSSRRFKNVRKLLKESPSITRIWGLTGTPSPNGLMDLWSQLFLLDGGERLGKGITGFRERYFSIGDRLPNGVVTRWNLRPGADARIHTLIEDICLSMETDGRIDLPPVSHNLIQISMPQLARVAYETMKKEMIVNLDLLGGGAIHTASGAAALTNKLSQIAAGFMYHDDFYATGSKTYDLLHREKADAVMEIVAETGSPVLVAYRYTAERDLIAKALGRMAHLIDEPEVIPRWNQGDIPVLLAHPQSVGHGLNLQHGGHTLVWSTAPWSLEEYDQMNKRLFRQGQEQPVIIHHLMAAPVDQAILQRLRGKATVQDALLMSLESVL